MTKAICFAYGENFEKWFARFKAVDVDFNDNVRIGRHIEANQRQCSRNLVQQLSVSHVTTCNGLHVFGKIQKVGKWV